MDAKYNQSFRYFGVAQLV